MTDIHLRPAQAEILTYENGRLAISAVPGSGKTFTLSLLAAQAHRQRPHQRRRWPTSAHRHLPQRQRRYLPRPHPQTAG
ncbi:MAG: hypothetical protein M5U34_14505 [Chloroflexi bacterium]|nr:hypothetical protein [Chloroflexota bacterium]